MPRSVATRLSGSIRAEPQDDCLPFVVSFRTLPAWSPPHSPGPALRHGYGLDHEHEHGYDHSLREVREARCRVVQPKLEFSCGECGAKFAWDVALLDHLHGHLGRDLFQCGVCSLRLTTAESLRRHQLLHSGEKPFGCPKCSKRYRRHYSLEAHQERQHRDDGRRPPSGIKAEEEVGSVDGAPRAFPRNGSRFGVDSGSSPVPRASASLDAPRHGYAALAPCRPCGRGKRHASRQCSVCLQAFSSNEALALHRQFACGSDSLDGVEDCVKDAVENEGPTSSSFAARKLQCPVCCRDFVFSGALTVHARFAYSCQIGNKIHGPLDGAESNAAAATERSSSAGPQDAAEDADTQAAGSHEAATGSLGPSLIEPQPPEAVAGVVRGGHALHRSISGRCALPRQKRMHMGAKPHACTVCSRRFMLHFALRRHLLQHHAV